MDYEGKVLGFRYLTKEQLRNIERPDIFNILWYLIKHGEETINYLGLYLGRRFPGNAVLEALNVLEDIGLVEINDAEDVTLPLCEIVKLSKSFNKTSKARDYLEAKLREYNSRDLELKTGLYFSKGKSLKPTSMLKP